MQPHTSTSPKKPSPLSFGSPRASPLKSSDSHLVRSSSILRQGESVPSPSKTSAFVPAPLQPSHNRNPLPTPPVQRQPVAQLSNVVSATAVVTPAAVSQANAQLKGNDSSTNNSEAISRLHPAQARDLRESFQVLDRDSDGRVTREDVAEVLTQLGLDASPSTLHPYFPANSASALTLSNYLSSLSGPLASFSPDSELLAAFAAFDVDDSGQIDVDDLRDALMHTYPDGGTSIRALNASECDSVMEPFRGRRALAKGMFGGKEASRRGDVFRYKDFMSTISPAERDGQGKTAPVAVAAAVMKA